MHLAAYDAHAAALATGENTLGGAGIALRLGWDRGALGLRRRTPALRSAFVAGLTIPGFHRRLRLRRQVHSVSQYKKQLVDLCKLIKQRRVLGRLAFNDRNENAQSTLITPT